MASTDHHGSYYLPTPSYWPIIGSIGLLTLFTGIGNWLHHQWHGPYVTFLGLLIMISMICGWFGTVIHENERGLYDLQVDRSFRWGMSWFIFSEIMFFGAFFGALFYARWISVPILGGQEQELTNYLLWPNFKAAWPLLDNPDPLRFLAASETISAWGLPALNTLILLTSGVTITWAHWALKQNKRASLIIGLTLTVLLGIAFLFCQAHEYAEAYKEFGLKLNSGIYGTTFFILTGFHGAHVTVGTIMLITILVRAIKGHFTPERHFAFEAVAWYWHFVDVVWLFLFVFVYWL